MILVTLGHDSDTTLRVWKEVGGVHEVVNFAHASPTGYRLGRRVLGIGVDAAIVASKAWKLHRGSTFLAANPWTGVALRLLKQQVSVTGIYAVPGTRSWAVLRRRLAGSPVVALSESEAEAWRESGGVAVAVRYGNTFDYPVRVEPGSTLTRVFVGGTSDRDLPALAEVMRQARHSGHSLTFVLAMGRHNAEFEGSEWESLVELHSSLSQSDFGRVLAGCDVAYLPLIDSPRSAGHMVAVGALEAGIPVVVTLVSAISEYLDGRYIRGGAPVAADLPGQLLSVAEWGRSNTDEIRDYWRRQYSRDAYVARVTSALSEISRPA